ncbi:MAG: carbohydrate ABC transporter permease [Ruminococcus sp.]|nr:carbohydrate ABC transporter permease [Ruminococcus sp.]
MKKLPLYLLLTAGAAVMLYPMLWLIGASFKSNDEIFSSVWFIPHSVDTDVYKNAWRTVTPYNMGHYFMNTFMIIVPRTIFSVTSSVLVAYGFARFDFPLKRLFFALLLGGMAMPTLVTVMPLFLMWSNLGYLDTYIPLTVPYLFAAEGMFVFILIQFFKGVPKEFDEAARIDGCGALRTLLYVLIPCIRPAIVSIMVFTFLWTMNDFLTPLIMIQSVEKYPLSLALRLSVDSTGQDYEQNKVIALSVIGLIPSVTVFAIAQKKFVSGITAGGLTG